MSEFRDDGADFPAAYGAAVTPSNTVNFADGVCRALFVGGAGDVSVAMAGSRNDLVFSVGAGAILPVRAVRVNATGTTATGIVALW